MEDNEFYITPILAELSMMLTKFNNEFEKKLNDLDPFGSVERFRLTLDLDGQLLECYEEGVRVSWKSEK